MNEQELFWSSEFGDNYINRNISQSFLNSNINMFKDVLSKTDEIESILELGANVGMNLKAIKTILPDVTIDAVEINNEAAQKLEKSNLCRKVFQEPISTFNTKEMYDLTFTKTVLIHLDEKDLKVAYEKLFERSKKYILIAEYYNPNPVTIEYRGHQNKLFKRDFCSEIMSLFNNIELIDYKFIYSKDKDFPLDDITWFLLKKT